MSSLKSSALWSWEQRWWKSQRTDGKRSARRTATLRVEGLECRDLLSVTLSGGFTGFGYDFTQGITPPDTQVAAGPTAGMRRALPLEPTFASKKDPDFSRNVLISAEYPGKNL